MSAVKIDLEEGLAAPLHQADQTVQETAREMIVLELYRRGSLPRGKAAELLAMPRPDLIRRARASAFRTST